MTLPPWWVITVGLLMAAALVVMVTDMITAFFTGDADAER